jgi:hypothetical protein
MMEQTLAGAGVLCIVAAVLTRQLKAAGRTVPELVRSTQRQALLAGMGGVLLAGALLSHLVDPAEDNPLRSNIASPPASEVPSPAGGATPQPASQLPAPDVSATESAAPDTERPDRTGAASDSEAELRSRSRDRKRGPTAAGEDP